jgi:uncharacterized membrane protein
MSAITERRTSRSDSQYIGAPMLSWLGSKSFRRMRCFAIGAPLGDRVLQDHVRLTVNCCKIPVFNDLTYLRFFLILPGQKSQQFERRNMTAETDKMPVLVTPMVAKINFYQLIDRAKAGERFLIVKRKQPESL